GSRVRERAAARLELGGAARRSRDGRIRPSAVGHRPHVRGARELMTVLRGAESAFVTANTERSGVLIDAESYYRTLYRALERAERFVLISGWQFETSFRLL